MGGTLSEAKGDGEKKSVREQGGGLRKSNVFRSNGREAVPQMASMSPTPSAEQEG